MEDGGVESADPRVRRAARAAAANLTEGELTEALIRDRTVGVDMHGHAVVKGVTVNWLAQVFHMDHRTCAARLKDCPPLSRKRGGQGLLYDVSVAAAYLIKPVFDVEEYIKTMKVDELPARLQEGYWAAALKRQKWEENAGKLWRTDDVTKKFSETFLMIANAIKLWVDEMEAHVEVTAAQREALDKAVRELQGKITTSIASMPRVTPPSTSSMVKPKPKVEDNDDIDADIADVV